MYTAYIILPETVQHKRADGSESTLVALAPPLTPPHKGAGDLIVV